MSPLGFHMGSIICKCFELVSHFSQKWCTTILGFFCRFRSIRNRVSSTCVLFESAEIVIAKKVADFRQIPILQCTIQNFFLIWISRSFKKGASYNTISYFNQSFWFSGIWLILARNLGISGQNKSRGTENREITNNNF